MLDRNLWPKPHVRLTIEPTLLLLLTPPNSGSTAIAEFVAQLDSVAGLQEWYEAQWLVKGLCDDNRWSPDKVCDFDSIKAVWSSTIYRTQLTQPSVKYFFEKSPPNLARYAKIARLFADTRVVVNNRDPYAWISSMAYRNFEFGRLDPVERVRVLEDLCKGWINLSITLRSVVLSEGYPLVTYEDFCRSPTDIFTQFSLDADRQDVDDLYGVAVKDYEPQPIKNMNARHVARLSAPERGVITDQLAGHRDLLQFFGYGLDPS